MSIKVTIGESKQQEVKPFPKLMKSKRDNVIYLFLRYSIGIRLDCKGEYVDVEDWATDWNMSLFEDFNEPITLQNN